MDTSLAHERAPSPLVGLSAADVQRLGDGGILVYDDAFDLLALDAAHAIRALDARGALTPAALGRNRRHRPDIRGDRTAWFTEVMLPAGLRPLWPAFEQLRQTLNRDAWLGLRAFELQLASYPGEGARYARHLDTFRGDPVRRITAILYLNPDWSPEHGGQLRAHTPDGPIDVAPVLGRMVLFRSDVVPHAVTPSWAPRFAATAWYRATDEPLFR